MVVWYNNYPAIFDLLDGCHGNVVGCHGNILIRLKYYCSLMACLLSYLYSHISLFIMYCFETYVVVYKHLSMTGLLVLRKSTYPQSFVLIYGFLFELCVLNLNEEEEKKMKNSAHDGPIQL